MLKSVSPSRILSTLNIDPSSGGFGAFGTLVIKSFGFNSLQSTLIYIPQGFINMICIFFGGWLAQKLPNARIYVAIGMLLPTFIGLLLQIVLPRSNVAGLLIRGNKPSTFENEAILTPYYSVSIPAFCHCSLHLACFARRE